MAPRSSRCPFARCSSSSFPNASLKEEMVTTPPSIFSCFFLGGGREKKRASDSGRVERKTLFSWVGDVKVAEEAVRSSEGKLLVMVRVEAEDEVKVGEEISSKSFPEVRSSPFLSTFFRCSLDFLFVKDALLERLFSFNSLKVGGGDSPREESPVDVEAREESKVREEEELLVQGGEMGGVRNSVSSS